MADFGCSPHFEHNFSMKTFLKQYSINWPSLNIRSQLLSKISNNMYFETPAYTLYDVMKFECYLQSTPPAMADRAEMRGRRKYKKFNT